MSLGVWDGVVLIPYLCAMGLLMLFGLHRYAQVYRFCRTFKGELPPAQTFEHLPLVTVQLPIYNERYVARRLIDAACRLRYPKDRLEIQVLDDSTDDTTAIIAAQVEHWSRRGQSISHVRRPTRVGYKAGALAFGMECAKGDFFLIFDADFIPPPDLLMRTIHHIAPADVGMVQLRWGHLNRDYSLLTRLQSIFLDGHFVIEHFVRHACGQFFNFNGTAGIWRKAAIVEAGGWSADTLTEDLDLSYRAQIAGWRFVYLPFVAAPAELPVEIDAFKNQQYRWARGSIQTARKILPRIWRADLPLGVKLEATFHLTSNLAYLLLLVPCVLILPAMIRLYAADRMEILLLYALFFAFATLAVWVFFAVSQRAIYANWKSRLVLFPLLVSLGIGMAINNAWAVLAGFTRRPGEFVRTPKYGRLLTGRRHARSGYRSRRSTTLVLELLFTTYIAVTLLYALKNGMFGAVPFLILFLFGFAYVGGLSAWQAIRGRTV